MVLPALVIGFVLSTLIGAGFHALRGGGAGKLFLDLILGWLGFWLGQYLAARLGFTIGSLGSLHLGLAIPVALVFLLVGKASQLGSSRLQAKDVNWVAGAPPEAPFRAQVKIRYKAQAAWAQVTPLCSPL